LITIASLLFLVCTLTFWSSPISNDIATLENH
jgi:hypothetical protein